MKPMATRRPRGATRIRQSDADIYIILILIVAYVAAGSV